MRKLGAVRGHRSSAATLVVAAALVPVPLTPALARVVHRRAAIATAALVPATRNRALIVAASLVPAIAAPLIPAAAAVACIISILGEANVVPIARVAEVAPVPAVAPTLVPVAAAYRWRTVVPTTRMARMAGGRRATLVGRWRRRVAPIVIGIRPLVARWRTVIRRRPSVVMDWTFTRRWRPATIRRTAIQWLAAAATAVVVSEATTIAVTAAVARRLPARHKKLYKYFLPAGRTSQILVAFMWDALGPPLVD